MKIKTHQFPIKNSNPVISVAKDRTVLYSNEAGEPLLHEWRVAIGEKLPSNIGDIVQRVLSQHSPIKIEVKVGKKVYLTTFYHFTEDKCVNIYGFEKSDQKELEEKIQENKAKEVENLELSEVIDVQAIQSLMDDFYKLAHIPMSLDDIKGNVLVGVGWQDICTKFHRIHPDTYKHCIERRTKLCVGIPSGEFKLFRCKNNMWDMATPIIVGGHHVGNIFSGQFFFDDEPLDYEFFRSQATKHGFNEEEYIAALEKVPRVSRESAGIGISYLMKLANLISWLSYSNTMLAKSLAERDALVDELRESEKREKARSEELAVVLDAAPAAVMIAHDPRAIKMTGNRLSYEWIRLPEGTNISKVFPEGKRPETHRLFKDGVEISLEEMPLRIAASGKEVHDYEFDVVYPDGMKRHVLCNARPLHDEQGNPRGAIAALIDITDRKRAEKALQESEVHFRTLAVNSPDIITRLDRQYRHIYVNPAGEISYGFPLFELIGKTQGDLGRDTKNVKLWEEHLESAFITGKTKTIEYHISLEGKKYYFNTKMEPEFVDDKVVSVLTISRDITEIKESEAKLKETLHNLDKLIIKRTKQLQKAYNSLKESEKSLAEAQKMAHIGNWEWNIETDKAYWSEETYRIFGLSPQDPAPNYKELFEYIHPEDRDYIINVAEKAKNEKIFSIDFRIILVDGEERTVHMQSEVIFDEKNIPVKTRGTFQDITERKKSEEKLRESEEKYRNIVETANEGVLIIDNEARITYANKRMEDMLGHSRGESINRSIWDFLAEESKAIMKLKLNNRMQGIDDSYELKLIKKDGSVLWVHVNAKSLFNKYGEYVGSIGMLTDITSRKEAEQSLANFEVAREKEIHHRIKNNLQVVSSLLDFHAFKFKGRNDIKDSEVIDSFRESKNRVISMALIHEELYKGSGLETINFSAYVEKLANNLLSIYKLGNTDISLNKDMEEDLFFDMDIAIPLGTMINELVSNSLKHAFRGRDKGEIQIKIHREENRECIKDITENPKSTTFVLTVSDNGAGIPEDLDIEKLDSLGLQLVTTLVNKLGGELELKSNNGTEFIIRFTVTEKNK